MDILNKKLAAVALCGISLMGLAGCGNKVNEPSTNATTSAPVTTPVVSTSASPVDDDTPTATATSSKTTTSSASASGSPSSSASKSASASASASAVKVNISDIKAAASCDGDWIDIDQAKLSQYPGIAESICKSPVKAVVTSDGTTLPLIKEFWQGFASDDTFRGYVATNLNSYGITVGDNKDEAQKIVDKFGGKVCKLVENDIEC